MPKAIQKFSLVAAIILIIVVAQQLGLQEKLSLNFLKDSQEEIVGLYRDRPLSVLAVFTATYIIATALSVPGAVVLTLTAGAIFGFWVGTIVVSFASTIGASLACLGSRFLLRDWVQDKFRAQIGPINQGIANEGAFYLFTLRLIPIFPFFLINLVLGVTSMPMATFYWVSQVGMMAGTMVYVNAGRELAKIDSLGSILSPSLLLSFALLGLFPIAAKKIVSRLKRNKTKKASAK